MAIIPLFGTGVKGRSVNATVQRRLNLYMDANDDKSPQAFYSRPGTSAAITPTLTGTGAGVGPMVGMMAMYNKYSPDVGDWLQMAQEGRWFAWDSPQSALISGPSSTDLAPSTSRMAFAYNGTRGFAVNGEAAFGIVQDQPSSNAQQDSSVFPWAGATSVCFLAGRFIVNYPTAPGQFCWSPLNWSLFTTWDGLDFATAESSPDALVCVTAYRGQLVLWGTQTIEFWAPDPSTVFSNVRGSTLNWGLVAQWSVREVGGALYFLGVAPNARPQVCRLNGYQVEVISIPDVDHDILDEPALDRAIAASFTLDGHGFYVLNLTNTSWAYDTTTGTWAEWQTQAADGTMGRWLGQFVAEAWGKVFVSDYRNENIYTIEHDSYTDGGQPIVREIVTRHVADDLDRLSISEFALDVETGVGLETGQGSSPTIMLQVSRDGGHTFGNEMWTTLGAIGQYLQRVVWRRLGRARDFVFLLRVSDPVKVVLLAASLKRPP